MMRGRAEGSSGVSVVELVVVLALVALGSLIAVPLAAERVREARLAAAARELAIAFHSLRWRSVSSNRCHGMAFHRDSRGWLWYVVRDGNGNGLRTREIRAGVDPTLSGPHRVADRVEGARLGFPPAPRYPRIPPASGWLTGLDDPVRFGRSDLVSFSPLGSASSGTLYLTDGRTGLRGVVLFGPTARVRVWRWDRGAGRWKL